MLGFVKRRSVQPRLFSRAPKRGNNPFGTERTCPQPKKTRLCTPSSFETVKIKIDRKKRIYFPTHKKAKPKQDGGAGEFSTPKPPNKNTARPFSKTNAALTPTSSKTTHPQRPEVGMSQKKPATARRDLLLLFRSPQFSLASLRAQTLNS